MSINFSDSSIIGGPIDQEVLGQLNRRKKIYSKKSSRTSDEVGYLHANGVWIRMMSSVDVFKGKDQNGNKSYTNTHAKEYILAGGTLVKDKPNQLRAGVHLGSQFGNKYSAYENNAEVGNVPYPGITAFQVGNKDSFGTVRLAKVEFTCHSPEQLSKLDALFMRPGFEVLVEWGHSRWIDDEGNIQTRAQRISQNYFFSPGNSNEIIQGLEKIKKMSDFNSDGFYGRVSNFQWKFEKGSYDCSVDIISNGNLIESVKTSALASISSNWPGRDRYTQKDTITKLHKYLSIVANTQKESFDSNVSKSIYRKLVNYDRGTFSRVEQEFTYSPEQFNTSLTKADREAAEEQFRQVHYIHSSIKNSSDEAPYNRYISIAEFLALINVAFMPKDKDRYIVKWYVGDRDQVKGNPKTPFITYPGHLALDMRKALLPKDSSNNSPYVLRLSKHFDSAKGSVDDILNIYLNVNYILEVFNETVTGSNVSVKNVLSFIRSILQGLEFTLGGINEFDIAFSEENQLYYIVDRKVIPNKDKIQTARSVIDIVGIQTTAEDIQISSKNTPSLTTTVAVAATATHSDAGDDLLQLQKWNLGLKNRHQNQFNIDPSGNQKDIEEPPELSDDDVKRLKDFVAVLNNPNEFIRNSKEEEMDVMDNIAEYVDGLIEVHSSVTGGEVQIETRKKRQNPPGLIPIELSFKIKGISGLKIGQSFALANEQILPEKYRGEIGFIITGIDNVIENNSWKTAIKSQMIVTTKFEGEAALAEPVVELDEVVITATRLDSEPTGTPSDRKPVNQLSMGSEGVNMIKDYESFQANAYRDPGSGNQPITIGYGTTRINGKKVKLGDTITEAEASNLLDKQLSTNYELTVKRYVKVDLTQNEYDALVSFTYNVGGGNFAGSTLLRKLNEGDYLAAADQFLRWNKSDGQVMRGLTRRRQAEKDLFLKNSPGNTA